MRRLDARTNAKLERLGLKTFGPTEFEPRYNWSEKRDSEGNYVHAQEIKHRPVRGRGVYDCWARGVKRDPRRAEEIERQEAFKADLAQQLEEAGING